MVGVPLLARWKSGEPEKLLTPAAPPTPGTGLRRLRAWMTWRTFGMWTATSRTTASTLWVGGDGLTDADRDDLGLGPGDTEQAPAGPTPPPEMPSSDGGLTDADLGIDDDPEPSTASPRSAARYPETGDGDLDASPAVRSTQPLGPQHAAAMAWPTRGRTS